MGNTETLRRIWLFNANKIKPVHSNFVLANKSTDEVLQTLIGKMSMGFSSFIMKSFKILISDIFSEHLRSERT